MSVERIERTADLARLQPGAEAGGTGAVGAYVTGAPDVVSARHPATRVRIDMDRLRENRGVLPEDPGPAARAYRMLRTQILQRIRQYNVRALGVVSAADGEGKTLTAMNLAFAIAADSNQRVLLVDLDLRRPALARLLGLPVEAGLEAWFAGVASIGSLCWGIEGIERLEVVPTFAPVANSSEMLATRRAQDMIRDLKTAQRDGIVVFDLPPMLLTDDFLTVSHLLDGVVLVASEGITKRDDVNRTRELLGSVRLLGTVLNRASESEKRSY